MIASVRRVGHLAILGTGGAGVEDWVALCRRGHRAQGADVIRMGEREVLDYCAAERGVVDVGLADAELVEEQDEVRDEVVERLGQRCPSREAVPAEVVGDDSGCSGQPWNQLLEHAAIHGEGAWISTIGMPEPPVSRDEGVVVSEVDDGFFARRDVNLAGRFYPGVAATHRVNGTGTSNERSSVVDDA
jgi:hypothetical protein